MTLKSLLIHFLACYLLFNLSLCYLKEYSYSIYQNGTQSTQYISAQTQSTNDPSQYFLCGYALRSIKEKVQTYTCNCQPQKQAYKCDWCNSTIQKSKNGFKAVFCSTQNWNRQKQKFVQTSTTQNQEINGQWKETMCKPEQYVYKVAIQVSKQQTKQINIQKELGLTSLKLFCSNPQFTQKSTSQHTQNEIFSQHSRNNEGTFVSVFKIKYINGLRITGSEFGFEGMAMINLVSIRYSAVSKYEPSINIVQNFEFRNSFSSTVQKLFNSSKSYIQTSKWMNEVSDMNNYEVDKEVVIPSPTFNNKVELIAGLTQRNSFLFGKMFKNVISITDQLILNVSMCRGVNVTYFVEDQKLSLPYEVNLTFINRFTGSFITNRTVKGTWQGSMTSPIKSYVLQSVVSNCQNYTAVLTDDKTAKNIIQLNRNLRQQINTS